MPDRRVVVRCMAGRRRMSDFDRIRGGGVASASGYTAANTVTLTITDQDRALEVTTARSSGDECASGRCDNNLSLDWAKATLGGVTGSVFTASTSSTYSSAIRARLDEGSIRASSGENIRHELDVGGAPMYVDISAGSLSGYLEDSSNSRIVRLGTSADNVAEDDDTFNVTLTDLPAGFTAVAATMTVRDPHDRQVVFGLDSDSTARTEV